MREPEITQETKETTGAKLARAADEAREALVEFARQGKVEGDRVSRHRVQGGGDGVGSLVGGTGQIVKRRGYSSYSATKQPPWDAKNENRKKAKKAKASRRANR